jgi:hypothetical protein
MDKILERVWENLIGRTSGPMSFRLIIQPAVATFIAIRAGLKAALSDRAYRPELWQQGRKDVGKVFILAAALDSVYQLIVHRGVYVLELLIVATVLAIVPYVFIRGPVNRIARRRQIRPSHQRAKASLTASNHP